MDLLTCGTGSLWDCLELLEAISEAAQKTRTPVWGLNTLLMPFWTSLLWQQTVPSCCYLTTLLYGHFIANLIYSIIIENS